MSNEVQDMADGITPSQFHAADGTADWRVVGDGATAFYRTASFAASARLVGAIGELAEVAAHPPAVDIRADGVTVRLITASDSWFGPSQRDLDVARRISAVARALGIVAEPAAVQNVLVIVEGLTRPAVMPFWAAALDYERRPDSPAEDLVDPRDRGPALWFEDIREPGPHGAARIHLAVWVPPEAAEGRVAAAIAAGGHLVRDEFAPSWWTLADAEGHEVDISTTLGRE